MRSQRGPLQQVSDLGWCHENTKPVPVSPLTAPSRCCKRVLVADMIKSAISSGLKNPTTELQSESGTKMKGRREGGGPAEAEKQP